MQVLISTSCVTETFTLFLKKTLGYYLAYVDYIFSLAYIGVIQLHISCSLNSVLFCFQCDCKYCLFLTRLY